MSITFRDLGPSTYDAQLKDFIKLLEGNKDLPYVDTTGNPTIGWGFAINSDANGTPRNPIARNYLLTNILGINPNRPGLSAQAQTAENDYLSQLEGVLDGDAGPWAPDLTGTGASTLALRNDLNNILANRIANAASNYTANDLALIGTFRSTFKYNSEGEKEATFDLIKGGYEGTVTTLVSIVPPFSSERIALFAAAYQGTLGTIAFQIASALGNDNKAEAWYTLRYVPRNISDASRFYREAQQFGLYSNASAATVDEAQKTYRMYTDNRATIQDHETQAPPPTGVDQLFQALSPARNTIVAWAGATYGVGIDAGFVGSLDVLLASDDGQTLDGSYGDLRNAANLLIGQGGRDALIGGAGTDTLLGGGDNDILDGGAGNDELIGGTGDDMLDGGGDNNTLNGGFGFDTYFHDSVGFDTIIYADGEGEVIFNGHLLEGGKEDVEGSNVYFSEDHAFTYVWSGSGPLTINGSLSVANFDNGDLGIELEKKNPDDSDPTDPQPDDIT